MTLAECGPLRLSILTAIAKGGTLRLDLAGSGPWDLAGLQVVLAAVKTVRGQNRTAALDRVPDVFVDLVEKAGCKDFLSGSIRGQDA